jgi:uncharacterized protein (TIGR03000 family)
MRPRWLFASAISFLALASTGPVAAQNGRIWIGPPADPERYYRFATDNGIPGSGRYAYTDYYRPSLREALDQYGLFGRRFRQRNRDAVGVPATANSTGAEAATDARAAVLRVLLPADAELWIAGEVTSSRGPERLFVTPLLKSGGSYSAEIRARWFDNGREVVRGQTVTVYPGDRRTIDFRTTSEEPPLLNLPRKLGD